MAARRKILIALAGGAAALLIALAVLLATPAGTRAAFGLIERFSDGRFSVENADGALINDIRLTGIRVATPAVGITVASAELAWRPLRLLGGELAIADLALTGVDVDIREAPPEAAQDDADAGMPRPPLRIIVNRAAVERLAVNANGQRVAIDRLALGFSWLDERIAIADFSIVAGPHQAHADASATTRPAGPVSAELDYQGEIAGHDAEVTLGAGGTSRLVDLSLTLSSAANARLSGTVALAGAQPQLTLAGSHDRLEAALTGLPFDIAAGALNASATPAAVTLEYAAEIAGAPENRRLSIAATADLPASDDEALTAGVDWSLTPAAPDRPISGTADITWRQSILAVTHSSAAPFHSETTLRLDLGADDPPLDARIVLTDFGPLPAGDQTVTVAAATVTASGPLSRLVVDTDATLAGTPWEQASIRGNAIVTASSVDISAFTIAALNGSARAAGEIAWQPALRGILTVSAEGLDPAPLGLPEETRLGFDASVRLAGSEQGSRVDIDAQTLRGRWRSFPLTGRLNLALTPGQIRISDSVVAVGANRVSADIALGDTLSGSYTLKLPELAELDDRLAGALDGKGALRGSRAAPAGTLELSGTQLRVAGTELDRLAARIDLDAASDKVRSQVSINATGITAGDRQWERLVVEGSGTRAAHRLEATLDGPRDALSAALAGGLSGQRWAGRLDELRLRATAAGDWALTAPAPVTVDEERRVTATGLCVAQGEAGVCLALNGFGAGAGTLKADVNRVPAALATPWLPADVSLEGRFDGNADLSYNRAGQLTGTGALAMAQGAITVTERGALTRIPIENTAVSANADATGYGVKLDSDVPGWLSLSATGDIGRAEDGPLDIDLDADAADIKWIERFVPELAGSRGSLRLNAAIGGTRSAPEVTARLATSNALITLPTLGLDVDALELNVTTDESRQVALTGLIGSAGGGELKVTGTLDATLKSDWPLDAAVGGKAFALTRLPEADIDITPDIRVRAGKAGRVDITGEVFVPTLRFELLEVPAGTVSVSDDQVLLNPDGTPMPTDDGEDVAGLLSDVSMNIDIRLGDNVTVSGLGLSSGLSGAVKLRRAPAGDAGNGSSQIAMATGKVEMEGGRFVAYGQNLEVEKGAFLFGGPLDNPALDVRAVRADINDVTAGVLITGTARTPRIGLFSDPVLDDAEILSYILTGRGLNSASNSDASLVAQAALSFGLDQAGVITGQMRDLFQLDEFGLENSGEELQDTALVAGKRITPRLSLRTQLDLFDQLWSFFLRYDLTGRWAVEAESGRRQGADLIYSVDHERFLDILRVWSD